MKLELENNHGACVDLLLYYPIWRALPREVRVSWFGVVKLVIIINQASYLPYSRSDKSLEMSGQPLPSLMDILTDQTESPIDLQSFYMFMAENYKGVEYLTFWIDANRHLGLCKEYVNNFPPEQELQRERSATARMGSFNTSGYPSGPQRNSSPNSSLLYEVLRDGLNDSEEERRRSQRSRWSQRTSQYSNSQVNNLNIAAANAPANASQPRLDTPTRVSMFLNENPPREINLDELAGNRNTWSSKGTGTEDSPPLLGHSRRGSRVVTRQDIYNNVDVMIAKYFMPSSPDAIHLPGNMEAAIRTAAQGRGKDDPAIFDNARIYVYTALEREAYPAFLTQRALCNVQPDLSVVRLLIGLLALFGAFWLGFAGILIDWSRPTRCWVVLPFFIGWYFVLSSLYNVDVILGAIGKSESIGRSPLKLDPVVNLSVRSLLRRRALFVAVITAFVIASFCVLFIFVPGHHL